MECDVTGMTCPKGYQAIGAWHTHGASENPADEHFSPLDKHWVKNNNRPLFLFTPSGNLWMLAQEKDETKKANEPRLEEIDLGTLR